MSMTSLCLVLVVKVLFCLNTFSLMRQPGARRLMSPHQMTGPGVLQHRREKASSHKQKRFVCVRWVCVLPKLVSGVAWVEGGGSPPAKLP